MYVCIYIYIYMYIYIYICNVHIYIYIYKCTHALGDMIPMNLRSCAQVQELLQSHCGDNFCTKTELPHGALKKP